MDGIIHELTANGEMEVSRPFFFCVCCAALLEIYRHADRLPSFFNSLKSRSMSLEIFQPRRSEGEEEGWPPQN